MALSDFLFGEKAKYKKLPTMAPEQQQLFSQLLGGLGGEKGGLSQSLQHILTMLGGGSEAEQALGSEYQRKFQEETIPQLAEKFAGSGALSSSGFGQSLGAAGSQLQSNLANIRGDVQKNALEQLTRLLGFGLSKEPFAYGATPASEGFIPSLISNSGGQGGGGGGGAGGALASALQGLMAMFGG